MAKMKKIDIIDGVYRKIGGISKKEAGELIEKLLEIIKENFLEGKNLKISGFGSFIIKEKKERRGINPRTKQPIIIPTHRTVKFRSSKILIEKINENKNKSDDGVEIKTTR